MLESADPDPTQTEEDHIPPETADETPPGEKPVPEEAPPKDRAPSRDPKPPDTAAPQSPPAADPTAAPTDGAPAAPPAKTGAKRSTRARKFQLRTGVYHISEGTDVRLVRLHRYRSGMFEVFEFKDEDVPQELRDTVVRQGGWRDENRQWYDLVEGAHAKRYEVLRRNPSGSPGCDWEDWTRLGSRYSPARPCSECGNPFRHADAEKTLCGDCIQKQWEQLNAAIHNLQQEITDAERLPKGSWQLLRDFRAQIDQAEKQKLFSRVRVVRLRQRLHPIYRSLIDRRREEQDAYRTRVEKLEASVKGVVERSLASDKPERSVVEELKRLRLRLRELTDQRKLGIREFRRFIGELRRASEREEEKFTAYRKEQSQRQARWEEGERAISSELERIEIGLEHSPENWQRLLELKEEIGRKHAASEIGPNGRRRLLDLVNPLLDQEGNLRDMARQDAVVKRQVKKETSRKRTNALKKSIRKIAIGLSYTQSVWDELVGIQRTVIQMKNEGAISTSDFKEVMTQVNDKLDTLKKLRGWSKQDHSRGSGRS